MEKDQDKPKEPMFPAPYEYLEELIAKDLHKYNALDKDLQDLIRHYRKPKPYQLNYEVPGFSINQPEKNYDGAIAIIKGQKKETLEKIYAVTDKQIKSWGADEKDAQQLRDIVYEHTNPDPTKDKGPLGKKAYHKQPKDIDEAQRSMYWGMKKYKSMKDKSKRKDDLSPGKE